MSSVPVSQKTELTAANRATGDELYIIDISESSNAAKSKKIKLIDLSKVLKLSNPFHNLLTGEAVFTINPDDPESILLALIDPDNNQRRIELS